MLQPLLFASFANTTILNYTAVMLSISASRYTLFTQVTFIATNAFGMLIAVFYNARTPDLYPNNAHHKIGWIITVVVSAHVAVGVIARRTLPRHAFSSKGESNEPTFMPLMTTSEGEGYADESQEFRPSSERSHSPADYRSSLGDNSDTTQVEPSDDESGLPTIRKFRYARHRGRFSAILNFLETLRWSTNSQSLFLCLSYAYNTTDRIILPFGFIAFATGIATFGRFFVRNSITPSHCAKLTSTHKNRKDTPSIVVWLTGSREASFSGSACSASAVGRAALRIWGGLGTFDRLG